VSALLNQAAALQLPQDEAYFSTAKTLRRELLEAEMTHAVLPITLPLLPTGRGEMTFGERLDLARSALAQLRVSVEALRSQAPESLDGFGAVELLGSLQESLDALEQPTFRIVPVGVTNGGKSTIGGALMGRALVPRGSGEVSMGVLHFMHCPQGLKIRELWPPDDEEGEERIEEKKVPGDWITCDAAVAGYLKRQMADYVEHGYRDGKPFPSLEVETPLLPGHWHEMFALPSEVGFEFRDVPGLNSTDNNDRNLAIIQKAIRGCFCVFIFDWNETNTARADMLLGQVRDMLEETGADPESVLFVLNKFDGRDTADGPADVERRLTTFRQTLQEGLHLAEPPDLITLSGRLWFNGQVAWGPTALSESPSAPPVVRATMLKALVHDDTGTILKLDEADPRRRWFIEKLLPGKPQDLSTEDFRYLMREIVYPVSGAQQFRERIAERLRRRCATLVIRPLVIDALQKAESFLAAIRKRFIDAQLDNTDQITSEIEHIRHCRTVLAQTIQDEHARFTEPTTQPFQAYFSAGQEGRTGKEIKKQWAERKIDIHIFIDLITALRKDLADNLAKPLREFQAGQALPVQWRAILQEQRANALYQKADTYFRLRSVYRPLSEPTLQRAWLLSELSQSQEERRRAEQCRKQRAERYGEYAVQTNNATGLDYITATENAHTALQQELVYAVAERSRFIIQQRLSALETQAQALLDSFYECIEQTLKKSVRDDLLVQAILAGKQPMSELRKEVNTAFRQSGTPRQVRANRKVVEKQTDVIETAIKYGRDSIKWLGRILAGQSTTGLFKKETKTVYVSKEHVVSIVPNGQGVEEDTNQIFAQHTKKLQKALLTWLSDEFLGNYAARLGQDADHVLALLKEKLEAQTTKSSAELLREIHQWAGMEKHLQAGGQELERLRWAMTDVASEKTV